MIKMMIFVEGLLINSNNDFGWIGFNDLDNESIFSWLLSESSYTNWEVGEPTGALGCDGCYPSEDCAVHSIQSATVVGMIRCARSIL